MFWLHLDSQSFRIVRKFYLLHTVAGDMYKQNLKLLTSALSYHLSIIIAN